MHRDPVQSLGAAARLAVAFAAFAGLSLAVLAPPVRAEGRIQKLRGHLGLGYAKLVSDPSPGGSFSMGVGVDYPVADTWRAGLVIGYDLLGGSIEERGSLVASVDYSMLEVLALAHWKPGRLGPLRRISFGPGLFAPRAELSTSAGGAAFSDIAVDEAAPGLAFDGTLIQSRESAVRIGLETGVRFVFLDQETWSMVLVRAAFHY